MANYSSANVIFVDTTAFTYAGSVRICGIKYVGASTSSLTIRGNASSTGPILWTDPGTTTKFEQIEIVDNKGIYVELTGTASVFIYLCVE